MNKIMTIEIYYNQKLLALAYFEWDGDMSKLVVLMDELLQDASRGCPGASKAFAVAILLLTLIGATVSDEDFVSIIENNPMDALAAAGSIIFGTETKFAKDMPGHIAIAPDLMQNLQVWADGRVCVDIATQRVDLYCTCEELEPRPEDGTGVIKLKDMDYRQAKNLAGALKKRPTRRMKRKGDSCG